MGRLSGMRIAAFLIATAAVFGAAQPATASDTARAFPTPNVTQGFTPQGMTMWGSRIVMAEYKAGANTRLVAVSAAGKVYGQVSIAPTHAGGIAVVGNWLYVQNADTVGQDTVRRYRLADFTKAMAVSHKAGGHPAYIKSAGLQQLDPWQFASFMATDGVRLYAGHHGVGVGARMYTYTVDQATGHLAAAPVFVLVPENAQGAALDSMGQFVFTAGGGVLSLGGVVRAIPSHAEGIVIVKGFAYVAFEGGARYVLKAQL